MVKGDGEAGLFPTTLIRLERLSLEGGGAHGPGETPDSVQGLGEESDSLGYSTTMSA